MSDERDPERAPDVLSSADEPAVVGDGARVPEVDDWQRAADSGAIASARAGGDQYRRGAGPPWVPASARFPGDNRAHDIEWLRAAAPNEGSGARVAERFAEDGGVPYRSVCMRNEAESPFRYLMDPVEQLQLLEEID